MNNINFIKQVILIKISVFWNVINVTNMSNMFNSAVVFNQYVQAWNTDNVTDFTNMFYNATAMKATYNIDDTPTQDTFNKTDLITNSNIITVINYWISDSSQAIFTRFP